MKLIALKCPGCGAELEVNSSLKQAVCNYCGQTIYVQKDLDSMDARQFGFEFEHGRMEAQSTVNEDLVTRVRKLEQVLTELNALNKAEAELRGKISQIETKINSSGKLIKRVITLSCLFGGLTIAVSILLDYPVMQSILWGLIAALAGGILAAISFIPAKVNAHRLEKVNAKYEKLVNAKKQIMAEGSSEDIKLIPDKYWNSEALGYICDVLTNKRAMSIQQAINLYEDNLYKQKQLMLQEETMRYQQDRIDLEKTRQKQQQLQMQQDQENLKELGKDIIKGAAVLGASAIVKGIINRKR